MAKKKTELSASVALVSENPSIKKPRLVKLIIRNFRCIGKVPVEIDLNDIVVLVGPNNVGKSSILKAYELVMSQGSNEGKLNLEDFPNGKFDPDNLPEIELLTVIYENTPGEKWIGEYEGEMLVRERWIWHSEGNPIRQGWDTKENIWSDEVPWGAPNVANSRRPQPHRVNAFDPPDLQARAITDLLMKAITDRVKALKADDNQENEYLKLLASVKLLQSKIVEEAQGEIDKAKQELTGLVEKVFPGYQIDFDAKPNDGLDKSLNLFKGDAQLLMGPKNGYLSTIDRQGSGARRTLLWTALKYLSESNQKVNEDGSPMRPHLLLLDEPEICLHPNAVRDACNVLYELPSSGHWQVMVTTHSPVFIDFSRDNTTIVRVDRNHDGNVKGTTVFRPDKVKLTEDDKLNLKLLNLCDPYVAEFFLVGKL